MRFYGRSRRWITLVQIIDDRLVDAGACLAWVEILAAWTSFTTLHVGHAHARFLVPVLASATFRSLFDALLIPSIVTGEVCGWVTLIDIVPTTEVNWHAFAILRIDGHRSNAEEIADAFALLLIHGESVIGALVFGQRALFLLWLLGRVRRAPVVLIALIIVIFRLLQQ